MAEERDTSRTSQDSRIPKPGDWIMARFRFSEAFYMESSEDENTDYRHKIRPALVLAVEGDGDAILLAGSSSRPDRFGSHIKLTQEDRAQAGLTDESDTYIKINDLNKIHLPSNAVFPVVDKKGRMKWRMGTASDDLMDRTTKELGFQLAAGTVKPPIEVAADQVEPMNIKFIRKVQAGEDETREEKIKRRAADLNAENHVTELIPKSTYTKRQNQL